MIRKKNKVEHAIYFATKAHTDQKRKIENVNMIFHPFIVGMILEKAGCSEDLVAAGMLHDVVEDTDYTFDDIEREFGKQVRDYVYDASEPDKTLSWEERKAHTVEFIKQAPFESKLLVAADKISNLEYIADGLEIYGEEKTWGVLKGSVDNQKWYYTNVYEGCILNQDKEHPIFKRYKSILNELFGY